METAPFTFSDALVNGTVVVLYRILGSHTGCQSFGVARGEMGHLLLKNTAAICTYGRFGEHESNTLTRTSQGFSKHLQ